MKKKLLSMMIACLIIGITNAQEIEPCVGNSQRNMANLEQSAIFNVTGINLNKYDWSNPDVNCHINETINEYSSSKLYKYLGYGGVGLGIPFLISSFGSTAKTANKQGTFLGIGVVLSGAGVYSFINAKKKQTKSDQHMQNVSTYYRENDLFE